MALTVSSISPPEGIFIGNFLCEVTGEDFELPIAPYDFGPDGVDLNGPVDSPRDPLVPKTFVDILVREQDLSRIADTDDGSTPSTEVIGPDTYRIYPQTADNVKVLNAYELSFLFPRLPYVPSPDRTRNYTIDVILRIRTTDGAETLDTTFTLKLPPQGRDTATGIVHWSVHASVVHTVIGEFRRHVLPNTHLIPNKFFEEYGVKGLGVVAEGQPDISLPCIVVMGPLVKRTRAGMQRHNHISRLETVTRMEEGGPVLRNTEALYNTARSRLFELDFFVLSKSRHQMMHILDMMEAWTNRTHRIRYELFRGVPAVGELQPSAVTSTVQWARYPEVDETPALLHGSVSQGRARLCIYGVPVGLYADPAFSLQARDFEHDPALVDIITQAGGFTPDAPATDPARIIDVGKKP